MCAIRKGFCRGACQSVLAAIVLIGALDPRFTTALDARTESSASTKTFAL
jgi:hypothetical protein